ncbi:glycosyltransferase [Robiginitalea aurantiaca]|uniref:Glycosyltransferase n=1 Tax=Robiginitalea aurantiaca TaxID=3056915 RepID=A0ABT7WIV3_9FLAO|nr:glycosyltransferase [Robiginitalea aurantiaca]MDM9632798.1 glycosyltransferase [Robiginitalea aurantiaca]
MSENMFTKSPNIAFLLGSLSGKGGIERVTSIIGEGLSEKNVAKVHIISFQPFQPKKGYSWNDEISYFNLLSERKGMRQGIIEAALNLRKYLSKNKIDILIVCGHRFCLLGGLSVIGKQTKMIYWSHSSFYGEKNKYKWWNEQFGGFFSKCVVSLTKADVNNYKNKTLSNNVFQIYNPIDDKLLEDQSVYNPHTNKIISVGRLNEQKRFDTNLIEVAKIVLHKNPHLEWHIYGDGELRDVINNKIIENNLVKRVKLMGNVKGLYNLYNEYSLMVMTSGYEGFPMVLLEGMSKNLPLLSFDIPTGPNEIIQNNSNGFLIPAFNYSDMAEKIEYLMSSPDILISFSENNRQYLQPFRLSNIMGQWCQLLVKYIEDKSKG